MADDIPLFSTDPEDVAQGRAQALWHTDTPPPCPQLTPEQAEQEDRFANSVRVTGNREKLACEVYAEIVERMAVKGEYKANDIRSGNLTPDDDRAIAAMLAFADRIPLETTVAGLYGYEAGLLEGDRQVKAMRERCARECVAMADEIGASSGSTIYSALNSAALSIRSMPFSEGEPEP